MADFSLQWQGFADSLTAYVQNFSFHTLVMAIMMLFMLLGLIDKLRGNKWGYGEAFDNAFHTMGPLALCMAGAIAAAPLLCQLLSPLVAPLYRAIGASPALFAPTFLALDMGGYPLAMEMCEGNEALGNFGGLILGSTMGCTLIFTIPFALTVIRPGDRSVLAAGILAGMITIPLGCLAGGLAMASTQYALPLSTLVINLLPILLISALVALGLFLFPAGMMRFFSGFGRAMTVLILVALGASILQSQTGIHLPYLSMMVETPEDGGLSPLMSGLLSVGQIAIVLAGALPMVEFVKKAFARPLAALGRRLSMNEAGCASLIASMANSIVVFEGYGKMNTRGRLLNAAFAVSASFMLGDHLGFTAAVCPDMIMPVIVAKAVAGFSALLLAHFMAPWLMKKLKIEE